MADSGGVNEIRTNVFLYAVADHCRFVLMAVAELERLHGQDVSLRRLLGRRSKESVERYGFPPSSRDAREFDLVSRLMELQGIGLEENLRRLRYHIDSIVNHARRVELLLWPAGTGDARRGEQLRDRLGITDEFPMRDPLRQLRNGWQHLDERMDKHGYGRRLPPEEADEEKPSPTGFNLKSTPEWVVEVNGVRLELEPVVDQVRILLAKCQLALKVFDNPEFATFYRQQLET